MDESSWLQNEVSGLSVVGKNARVFALDNNERDSSGDPGYSGRCGFAHLLPGMLELPCSREGRPVPATGCVGSARATSRSFHRKAACRQSEQIAPQSLDWVRSHKTEVCRCSRIKRADAATRSALSRASLPSGRTVTSSNPVRIPCPLSSPRRLTAQHAMPKP